MSSSFPQNDQYPSSNEGGCLDGDALNYDPNATECCENLVCCVYAEAFYYKIVKCSNSSAFFYGQFEEGSDISIGSIITLNTGSQQGQCFFIEEFTSLSNVLFEIKSKASS